MRSNPLDGKNVLKIIAYVIIVDFSFIKAWNMFKGIVAMSCFQYTEHRYAIHVLILGILLRTAGVSIISAWMVFIVGRAGRNRFRVLAFVAVTVGAIFVAQFILTPYADPRYVKIEDGLYSFRPGAKCKDILDVNAGKVCDVGADGFRTCAFSDSAGGPLIVLIGDSFVFGWRLSDGDTLCDSLGNELHRRGFGDVTIKNMGIPALHFDSYGKMARMISSRTRPDWIFVGYLSYKCGSDGTDTLSEDLFSVMAGLEKMSLYRLTAVLFNKPTTYKALQIYNHIVAETPPGKKTASRFSDSINIFKELSDRSNVVILSYYGPDEFTDILKKKIRKLTVIDLSLTEKYRGEYVILEDGHPTAKANQEHARRIADYIMEKQVRR